MGSVMVFFLVVIISLLIVSGRKVIRWLIAEDKRMKDMAKVYIELDQALQQKAILEQRRAAYETDREERMLDEIYSQTTEKKPPRHWQ